MEDFNLELLQKFRKFKTEKILEQVRVREDQENKFQNYVSVSEEVSEYLHSSIWELKTQVHDLRRELVSLRATKDGQSKEYQKLSEEYQKQLSEEEQKVEVLKLRLKIGKERTQAQANEMASLRAAKDEEIMEYRKLLIEEKQKNKELSDEVERLKKLQEELISSRLKNTKDAQLCVTTAGGHVSRETTKHRKKTGGRMISNLRENDQ